MGCRGEMREEVSQDALNGRWDGMPEALHVVNRGLGGSPTRGKGYPSGGYPLWVACHTHGLRYTIKSPR